MRKSKKTGGRKSGVPMPVVIGVGLLAVAAALLLVTRTDLGRQLMTAVPGGSPSPTPNLIVWECKLPAQYGCECAYSDPKESQAPKKTVKLPVQFKFCSSSVGSSLLKSDATSARTRVCVDQCNQYISALGFDREAGSGGAGGFSTNICHEVLKGGNVIPCRSDASGGDLEPFTWNQCEAQCRCLYKKDTSTKVLSVPNQPVNLYGDFCAAFGHPPAWRLKKFVSDCPSNCQDATPAGWQYVKLAEPAYNGQCEQNEPCERFDKYGIVSFYKDKEKGDQIENQIDVSESVGELPISVRPVAFDYYINDWVHINAPFDIDVIIGLGDRSAVAGEDYKPENDVQVTIKKGESGYTGGVSVVDDSRVEGTEWFYVRYESADERILTGNSWIHVNIMDDDEPAASDTPAPSETP